MKMEHGLLPLCNEAAVRVLQFRMKLSGCDAVSGKCEAHRPQCGTAENEMITCNDAVSGKCNAYRLRVGVPG